MNSLLLELWFDDYGLEIDGDEIVDHIREKFIQDGKRLIEVDMQGQAFNFYLDDDGYIESIIKG